MVSTCKLEPQRENKKLTCWLEHHMKGPIPWRSLWIAQSRRLWPLHNSLDPCNKLQPLLTLPPDLNETLRISIHSGGTADIDDISRFAVLDSKVRCCCSEEPKGRRVVNRKHRVPLLVSHLTQACWCSIKRCPEESVLLKKREGPRFQKNLQRKSKQLGFQTLCITPSQVKPALLTII